MKIPSSSNKRYLGGADWCVAALRQGTLENTGRPTVFHVAVFLEGIPDVVRLESEFQDFCTRFPLLWGEVARCWCLAPYWKIPASSSGRRAPCRRAACPDETTTEDVVRRIEALANRPDLLDGCAVALETATLGTRQTILVFSFDHRLFDASGGERFIDLFFRVLDGTAAESDFPNPRPTEPACLDHWLRRFAGGRKLNRAMQRLSPGASAGLDLPPDVARRPFRFRVVSLDESESRRVQERAFAAAGYLMFMPYALATAAAVLCPKFAGKNSSETRFVVTVSTNRQHPPRDSAPHFFFNDLSFLYFGFPAAAAANRDELAVAVRDQMIAQVKEGMPGAIEDANLLMRILSPRLFWKFMVKFFRNRLSSFALTCLGEPALQAASVLDCPVLRHLHFPVIPTPPGIGLVVSRSGTKYHVVLSYIEGILPESEIEGLLESFRSRWLGEPTEKR